MFWENTKADMQPGLRKELESGMGSNQEPREFFLILLHSCLNRLAFSASSFTQWTMATPNSLIEENNLALHYVSFMNY